MQTVEEKLKALLRPHHHQHHHHLQQQQKKQRQEMGLPVERVSGRHQLDGRAVLGVELRVPATMTLYHGVFLRLDVHRGAHVALVVPDHYVALQLTSHSSSSTFHDSFSALPFVSQATTSLLLPPPLLPVVVVLAVVVVVYLAFVFDNIRIK